MRRGVLTLLLTATMAGSGQQIGQNAPSNASSVPTLSVSSQLVIETVSVKDKNGNPVNGLTAKDFTLTEDGAPQKIQFCEHQDLAAEGPVIPAALPAVSNLKVYYHLSPTQIAPEPRGSTLYKNRRLLALYFDMTALPPADQVRALTAGQSFIREQMEPDDLVAILRYSGGGVDVLADFTADRTRLLSILETMVVGEGQAFAEAADDASSSDTGAAFGQDDSEFNIFNTDRQLAALQTAAKMLGELSEKKSLVYFASGLRLNGLDNQAQLHATINDAIRSGVNTAAVESPRTSIFGSSVEPSGRPTHAADNDITNADRQ